MARFDLNMSFVTCRSDYHIRRPGLRYFSIEFVAAQGHYRELSGLTEIAERCHLDSAYLCRLFAQSDYQSPYDYLTRLKRIYAAGAVADT
jgi:hypothetical protein